MYDQICKMRFIGYKSFTGTDFKEMDIDKPLCLIIGKNNSGKSSILDILEHVYGNYRELGKLVYNGTQVQIGYKLPESKSVPSINFSGTAKQISPSIAWYCGLEYDPLDKYNNAFEQVLGWAPAEINTVDDDIADQRLNAFREYGKKLKNMCFVRINADRDIVPEEAEDEKYVDPNGNGTTNLIRHFIIDSELDETAVENLLLTELNTIMGEDAHFESIRIQQISNVKKRIWEIYLKESGQNRYPLSKTGSGLKTIILMLVNLHLIPKLVENIDKHFVFAFEELENNLHPALQRRVFNYLYNYIKKAKNGSRIFLTTHSHIAINIFSKNEDAVIYHVVKEHNVSEIRQIESYYDKTDILDDLDIKASDILQSNGIIWVEGPSDRIYIKKWLEVFTNNRFIEGRDYQFLYYGGKLLSHYELGADEAESEVEDKSVTELLSILTTNRNAAIVIDSDITTKQTTINKTKQRVKNEFEKNGFMCWITWGKEVENYLTAKSINKAYGLETDSQKLKKNVDRYNLFPTYIKNVQKKFSNNKVPFAKKVAPCIQNEDYRGDLIERIEELANMISKWNAKEIINNHRVFNYETNLKGRQT